MNPAMAAKRVRESMRLALVALMCCSCSAVIGTTAAAAATRRPPDKTVASQASARVFTRTLRKGDRGADVQTLQMWLSEVGYRVPATGYFGPITNAAVKRFKQAHRLFPVTGSVGNRCALALLAAVTKAAKKSRAADTDAQAVIDPIPGFTIERDDMGVDAWAREGAPIYAPAASTLVQVLGDWYEGQPLLLFEFDNPPSGVLSDYWYVAEQIAPVTTRIGASFKIGQEVASFASRGTGIEIGWGSPTSNARTLADVTDPAAANPPPGSTTVWGESFKKVFHIP